LRGYVLGIGAMDEFTKEFLDEALARFQKGFGGEGKILNCVFTGRTESGYPNFEFLVKLPFGTFLTVRQGFISKEPKIEEFEYEGYDFRHQTKVVEWEAEKVKRYATANRN
jgi:hypothetical protein